MPKGGFLFRTPPYQKVSKLDMEKTLDELECVPSEQFFFGLEQKGTFSAKNRPLSFVDLEIQVKNFLNSKLLAKMEKI